MNLLFSFLLTLFISPLLSYKFNQYLYKYYFEKGKELNSYLYLIKIDYSLIQIIKGKKEDIILEFIKLIINYNFPISEDFKKILSNIHAGESPENELVKFISPSRDFNMFLSNILTYRLEDPLENKFNNELEESFKVYLKELTTKISIIFFVGIFFPIGLSFFVTFFPIKRIFILISIPIYLFLLNYLFRKFIDIDHYFMGIIKTNSQSERKMFLEFINLIERFSKYLENNISPERAFIKAYFDKNKNNLILKSIINLDLMEFLNGSLDFNELMRIIKNKLDSYRYAIIFNSFRKILEQDARISSNKIKEILIVLKNHIKLERKINVIIKGERIKVYVFIVLLPVILGTLGSLFSFFPLIIDDLLNLQQSTEIIFPAKSYNYFDLLIFLTILLTSNFISTYYFLATVSFKNKNYFLIFTEILLILSFSISLFNISPLII